jgi:hypothetical protein
MVKSLLTLRNSGPSSIASALLAVLETKALMPEPKPTLLRAAL